MKHPIYLLCATAMLCAPTLAQESPKEKDPSLAVNRAFMNLPEKTRIEFGRNLIKTQNLFNQKRIFDALEKISELEKIFPNHPAALNIKGACYVEIRNFKKANEVFGEVLKIAPKNTNVQFNIAEVEFVTKNWTKAHDLFSKLIPQLPSKTKRDKAMVRLCEFKLLLCKLKTDRKKEAIALQNKYDEW
ncbi:MAG: tetratricopeptide repeat protein, partial [Akkermansiaceae bacterium]